MNKLPRKQGFNSCLLPVYPWAVLFSSIGFLGRNVKIQKIQVCADRIQKFCKDVGANIFEFLGYACIATSMYVISLPLTHISKICKARLTGKRLPHSSNLTCAENVAAVKFNNSFEHFCSVALWFAQAYNFLYWNRMREEKLFELIPLLVPRHGEILP